MSKHCSGLWSLGTSGCSYLDTVAVNHGWQEGKPPIDTWQKAKAFFAQWHRGRFILTWENGQSFKCYHINIK